MSKTPLLTFRCPQDLINAIHTQMAETGLNKTDIAVSLLQNSVPSLPILDRSKLPKIGAIYFVITSSKKLLYIGRTENLFNRWLSHHRYQQFIETDSQSRIAWFAIDEDDLVSMPIIESDLITLLDTEYNGTTTGTGDFKGSVRIDKKLWNDFKVYCQTDLGTTISEKIRDMIEAELGTNHYWVTNKNYEEDTKTGANAREIRLLKERIDKLESLIFKTDSLTDGKTNSLADNKTAEKTDNETGEKSDLQKSYTHEEVAKLEALTSTSVSRYWTGKRSPQDKTFWDRWTRDEKNKGWFRAFEGES